MTSAVDGAQRLADGCTVEATSVVVECEIEVIRVKDALLNNPVRVYAIVSAALALLANYVHSMPVPLLLSLVAAVLGVGEVARGQVTPNRTGTSSRLLAAV